MPTETAVADEEAEIQPNASSDVDTEDSTAELRREIQMLREHDQSVREQAEDCAQLHSAYQAAKETASARKKAWETAVEDLQNLARQRPTFGPLFDSNGEPKDSAEQDPQAWRLTTIEALGITGKTAEKLLNNDPPLRTLGDLADWTKADKRFADIDGIGEAKAEKIEEAITNYWADQQQSQKQGCGCDADLCDGEDSDADSD